MATKAESHGHDHGDGHGHGHGGGDHVPHVLPLKIYLGTWIGLMVFTVITVAVSYVDFGDFNLWIAMLIASVKASLVALLFMHLRWDERFNSIILVSSLIFLAIFIGFTLADTGNRGRAEPIEHERPVNVKDPFNLQNPDQQQ
ncbi:MAG TPA: cytochrome C oxidase subunit IV family protein [Candidatus Nanopelagicales bacterium]|nr:cytochrome C oxidase subunit IV family protein [Candidatus Nanopelagicales bacterium]